MTYMQFVLSALDLAVRPRGPPGKVADSKVFFSDFLASNNNTLLMAKWQVIERVSSGSADQIGQPGMARTILTYYSRKNPMLANISERDIIIRFQGLRSPTSILNVDTLLRKIHKTGHCHIMCDEFAIFLFLVPLFNLTHPPHRQNGTLLSEVSGKFGGGGPGRVP